MLRPVGPCQRVKSNTSVANSTLRSAARHICAPGRHVVAACSLQAHARARQQPVRERQLLCAAHSMRQRVSSSFSNLQVLRLITSDLAVFKSFAFTQRKRLEFRASAYNFLSHPLWTFTGGERPDAAVQRRKAR